MEKIYTDKAPKPVGAYSQGVLAGNFIFVSGQIGIDPKTGKLRKNLEEQTIQVLLNIESILKAAGASRKNIVKTTIFLTDIADFPVVNRIYEEFFKENLTFPARATVEVSNLPLNAKVEIECIAVVEK